MLHRLLGLETEYAIRFTPAADAPAPRNDLVYETIRGAVGTLVLTQPGRLLSKQQFFVENGGEISYEVLPYAPADGLVEGATPECRGPSQALLYQKAQDQLLIQALPLAEKLLAEQGYVGSLGLIKNCRDAEGHIYGAQENYEAELASGMRLALWRAGLVLLFPLVLLSALLTWVLVLAVLLGVALALLGVGLAGLISRTVRRGRVHHLLFGEARALERRLGRAMYWLERALWEPIMAPFLLLARFVAFHRLRRDLLPFLVTRPIFTGAGTLGADGSLGLCEKGPAMQRVVRRSLGPADRAIFELGNLCKDLADPMTLRMRSYARLFRRRQRMQLGLSDSNMAQVAEYLKVAVTGLVIDMSEAGLLREVPRLRSPIAALRAVIGDPTLAARVPVAGGESMRALDIQRVYLEQARRFVHEHSAPSLEAAEVVKRWAEVLDALEADPDELFGRIDWVTKRRLIAGAGQENGQGIASAPDTHAGQEADREHEAARKHEAAKKIDLKYHELGVGYFARIESRGLAPRLVSEDEIERALREPPAETPAQIRSLIIRNLGQRGEKVRVSWREVRIGGPLRGRVIRLDDYRDD